MADIISQEGNPDFLQNAQQGVQVALDKSLGKTDSGNARMPVGAPAAAPQANDDDARTGADDLASMFFRHMLDKDRAASGLPPTSAPTDPSQPTQPAAPAPGSFGAKLAGAAGNLQNALGDAAAATKGGGGWLSGVERTAAAHGERVAREKQQQFENQERLKNDQINYAHAQVQTLLAQQQLRHADAEDRQTALGADQATAAAIDSVGTPVLQRNMDSDAIHTWMKDPKNKDVVNSATALIDHYLPPDENGYMRPVYTLYGAVPGEVKLNSENAELLSKYGASGQEFHEGDTVNGSTFIRNLQAAKTAQIMDLNRQKIVSEINKNEAEAGSLHETAAEKQQRNQIAHDPGFISTMNHFNNRPLDALDAATKVQNDPTATADQKAAATKLTDQVNTYFGQDNLEKERQRLTELRMKQIESNNNKQDKADNAKQASGRSLVSKSTDAYAKVSASNDGQLRNIAAAKDGNQLATSMEPLFTALGISTSEGVRRINQTEVDQAGPKVGSAYRQLTNLLDKVGSGTMSADQLEEAKSIARNLQAAAYDKYVRTALVNQHNYDLPDDYEILGPTGGSSQTLGAARRGLERSDLQDYLKNNGGQVPQGYKVRQNPQTKQMIYSTDQGKTWFDLNSGNQLTQ